MTRIRTTITICIAMFILRHRGPIVVKQKTDYLLIRIIIFCVFPVYEKLVGHEEQ